MPSTARFCMGCGAALPKLRQRRSLPAKLRFEVFKRDGFVCSYCGQRPPDVELHVDHVVPVASGGTDTLMNLVTACSDCNFGKGATPLDDDSFQHWEAEQRAERARLDQIHSEIEARAEDFLIRIQSLGPLIGFLDSLRDGWSVLGPEQCLYLRIARKLDLGEEPTVDEAREAGWQIREFSWGRSGFTNSWERKSFRLATITSQVLLLHVEPTRREIKEWVLGIEDEQYQKEAREIAQSLESRYREWEELFTDGISAKPDAPSPAIRYARHYKVGLLPEEVKLIASLVTYTFEDGVAGMTIGKHRKYGPTRKGLADAWACYQNHKNDYERAVTYGVRRSSGLITY